MLGKCRVFQWILDVFNVVRANAKVKRRGRRRRTPQWWERAIAANLRVSERALDHYYDYMYDSYKEDPVKVGQEEHCPQLTVASPPNGFLKGEALLNLRSSSHEWEDANPTSFVSSEGRACAVKTARGGLGVG